MNIKTRAFALSFLVATIAVKVDSQNVYPPTGNVGIGTTNPNRWFF